MERLCIIGAGDLGQQIAHHARDTNKFEVVGFFDDTLAVGSKVKDKIVLGSINEVENFYERKQFDSLVIAIGYKHMHIRAVLFNKFRGTVPFAILIHPSCVIDTTVTVGEGTVLYPGCIIDKDVQLGCNVLINVASVIAHDTKIGDHSFLSPRVAIAGFVNIGKSNIIGINSTIIDNVRLTDNVQIGGGAVVIKDIDKPGLYVGNPVRFVR